MLAAPLLYLLRLGRKRVFLAYELPAIGMACLLILIFILPFVRVPLGFAAILIIAALIARRGFTLAEAQPLTAAQ